MMIVTHEIEFARQIANKRFLLKRVLSLHRECGNFIISWRWWHVLVFYYI